MNYSLSFVTLAAVLCVSFAANISIKSVQRGAEYKVIGHDFSSVLKSKVAQSIDDDTEVCEFREAQSISIFFNCPDVCKPFDPETFVDEFAQCAPLGQFGCSRVPCSTEDLSPGFNCELNKTAVENDKIVCQGSKVIFDEINIEKFGEITFTVDVSAPPVQTDLYFLADTTGSMNEAIGTAVRKARDMVKVFGDRPNVAFGVGHYEDERDLDGGFEHQFSISEDTRLAIRAIRRWRTGDGQDVEEANLVALYRIATKDNIGWRQGSRKFVVYFGEYPGHEPTCDDSGRIINRETVIEALNEKNITVVAVNFGNLDDAVRSWPIAGCGGKTGSSVGQTTTITAATGGAVVSSNDQSQLVSLIENALRLVTRKYDVDASSCDDFLTLTHNPTLPIVLAPLQKAQIKSALKINEFICDAKDPGFACDLTYTESGANILGGVAYSFADVIGC